MKKIILITMTVLLSGCYAAIYENTTCKSANVCSHTLIKSKRDLQDFMAEYNPETKQAKIQVGKATAPPSLAEKIGEKVGAKIADKIIESIE